MTNDDLSLLQEYARHNSEDAFAALVSRHINLVYSVALRRVRDPHLAGEITQVVFIILARKAGSLGPKIILSGWLCRTARYTSAKALVMQQRRQRREQEAYMQSVLNEPESEVWPEIAPLLDDAMERLGRDDHDALVLRFFEGKNFKEVGAALGVSEDTAKTRVHRVLEKLRKHFAKRGVNSTSAIIAGAISTHSVQVAPVVLAKAVTAVAIAKGATATSSTLTLIKGALKIMAWSKMKTAIVAGTILVLATGTTTMVIKQSSHHSPKKLPLTPANMAFFQQESTKLVNDVKMATLACFMFADNHKNQFPTDFAQLNAQHQETQLSNAEWKFVAGGDKDSFTNPDKTIYFFEKEPRQSPDGKFFRAYATVNGRVFLLTSPDEDFTAVEKENGFLIR